jgi:hypothetical protein
VNNTPISDCSSFERNSNSIWNVSIVPPIGRSGRQAQNPVAVQVPERAFDIGNVDALWQLQRDARSVALADHAEADDEINAFWGVPRSFSLGCALRGISDAHCAASREELGIGQ